MLEMVIVMKPFTLTDVSFSYFDIHTHIYIICVFLCEKVRTKPEWFGLVCKNQHLKFFYCPGGAGAIVNLGEVPATPYF